MAAPQLPCNRRFSTSSSIWCKTASGWSARRIFWRRSGAVARSPNSTLATHINAARKAVGDSGEEQRLIRTVARKGVRFVGEVRLPGSEAVPAAGSAAAPRMAPPSPGRPAIAVLPFVNMSGEARQEYFSDGISEDIITALSKLRWFLVIARNTSFTYKGKAVHVKQIAEELGVGYVVEGSVRKDGGRVRITAQLIDATTGSHIWADRYDRELADVFAVQDEITDAIVAAIEPQLYAAENFRAQRKPPDNLDAWDLVMRALWHFWRMTREDNLLAQGLLEQAIAIDPNYAQAHAVLAVSHIFGVQMGWQDSAAVMPSAERAALAAVRIDNEDPWAHLALAFVNARLGRIAASLDAFETALRLNPNFSLAHGCRGLVLSWGGHWREGAEAAHRALRLSPARSVRCDLLWYRRLCRLCRARLCGSDRALAQGNPPAQRFRRRLARHDRGGRHGRRNRHRGRGAAGFPPDAARCHAGTGRDPAPGQGRRRTQAFS